jgi:hypothetical protein
MSVPSTLTSITAFLEGTRFDEIRIPVYAERERPTEFRFFAFSIYLRGGDRYLRVTQMDKNQGDQLEMDVVDAVEYDPSLVDDPEVLNATVDVTSQILGESTSFGVVRAACYLNERSDLTAGRVAAVSLTTDRGELMFDPLSPAGVRVFGGQALPDLPAYYAELGIPVTVAHWFPAEGVTDSGAPSE